MAPPLLLPALQSSFTDLHTHHGCMRKLPEPERSPAGVDVSQRSVIKTPATEQLSGPRARFCISGLQLSQTLAFCFLTPSLRVGFAIIYLINLLHRSANCPNPHQQHSTYLPIQLPQPDRSLPEKVTILTLASYKELAYLPSWYVTQPTQRLTNPLLLPFLLLLPAYLLSPSI